MWLCFGSWGGFRFELGDTCFVRICLGWISFVASSIDVENVLSKLVKENAALKSKEQNGHIAQQINGVAEPK
jgi:hypothetical protein